MLKELFYKGLIASTIMTTLTITVDLIFRRNLLKTFLEEGAFIGIGSVLLKFCFWVIVLTIIILFSTKKVAR